MAFPARLSPLSLAGISALLLISSFNGGVDAWTASSGERSHSVGHQHVAAARQRALQMAAHRYLMENAADEFWDHDEDELEFYDKGRLFSASRHPRRLDESVKASICFGKQFTVSEDTSMDMVELNFSGMPGARLADKEQSLHGFVASEMSQSGMHVPRFSAIPQIDQTQQTHSYKASAYHAKRTIYAFDPLQPRSPKLALADVEVARYALYPTTVRVYDSVAAREDRSRIVDANHKEVPRMVVEKMVLKTGAYVYLRRPDGTLNKHEMDGRNADLLVARIAVPGSKGRADTYEVTEMQSGRLLAKVTRQTVLSAEMAKGNKRKSNTYSLQVIEQTDRAMMFAIMVAMDGLNHDGSRERLIKRATVMGTFVGTAAAVAGARYGVSRLANSRRHQNVAMEEMEMDALPSSAETSFGTFDEGQDFDEAPSSPDPFSGPIGRIPAFRRFIEADLDRSQSAFKVYHPDERRSDELRSKGSSGSSFAIEDGDLVTYEDLNQYELTRSQQIPNNGMSREGLVRTSALRASAAKDWNGPSSSEDLLPNEKQDVENIIDNYWYTGKKHV